MEERFFSFAISLSQVELYHSPFLHYRLVSNLEKINIENAANQNHLKVRVVLVTCIFNIDFWKRETSR